MIVVTPAGGLSSGWDNRGVTGIPDPIWRPIERTRAYESVIDQVEERIAAGELGVGDRLPAERDLSARLGVSRAAIREAMRAMEAMGVVRSGLGRDGGAVLASLSAEALTRMLRLHIGLANFPMPDVIEARVMLERWSVGLAARHASEADLAHLRDLVRRMDDPDIQREAFNELDTAFHVAIADAGGNRLVAAMTTAIRASMATAILRSFHANPAWDSLVDDLRAGHAAVLTAIESRDPDAAADALESHVRFAFDSLSWGVGADRE